MALTQQVGYQEFIQIYSQYKWILYNFSSLNEQPGQFIKSPIFTSIFNSNSIIKWQLDLYPNGKTTDDSKGKYVSIYLYCLDNCNNILHFEGEFSLSITGKVHRKKMSYIFFDQRGHGYPKYISRDNLLADIQNGNDTLTIICTVAFLDASKNCKDPRLNLLTDVGSLLNKEEHSDIILVSNSGTQYKAHKAILVCRSKVFSAMLQHNMKESQDNVVKIEDVDDETLKIMLQYLYTGEVENIRDRVENLLIAGDKYELNDLVEMCTYYICDNLTIHNIFNFIQLAYTYNITKLNHKCKEYFLMNRKEIMSIEGRKKLKNLPRDIIENLFCDIARS